MQSYDSVAQELEKDKTNMCNQSYCIALFPHFMFIYPNKKKTLKTNFSSYNFSLAFKNSYVQSIRIHVLDLTKIEIGYYTIIQSIRIRF